MFLSAPPGVGSKSDRLSICLEDEEEEEEQKQEEEEKDDDVF